MTSTRDDDLRVVDNPIDERYEAWLDGVRVGFSQYRRVGDRLTFLHTEVDAEYEGRGIGGRLAAGALDDVRTRGLTFAVKCPFIAAYLVRHPGYEDLRAH